MTDQAKPTSPFQPITLSVTGMSCASCVRRVEQAAGNVDGVSASAVNYAGETLTVTPGEGFSAKALIAAVERAGYAVKPETVELEIDGMTCASCVARVEKALAALPSVAAVSVNLANNIATVSAIGGKDQRPALIEAVKKAGYDARAKSAGTGESREQKRAEEIRGLARDFWAALVLTIPVFIMEMGGHIYPPFHHWLIGMVPAFWLNVSQAVLATAVLAGPGRRFFVIGVPALLRGGPEMNSLVALGAGAAYLYSLVATFAPDILPLEARHVYYEAAVVIVTLILLGRLFEARAKGRTGEAIAKLSALAPKTARVERDGAVRDVAVDDVAVGDIVLIRPGERLPVDGTVVDGHSHVDEAMISGEPVPVEKTEGAGVIGGTINGNGTFRYRVDKVGADMMLSQIIRMVGEAQGAKLPIQATIDKVTGWFVPAVMAASALTFAVWLWLGPEPSLSYALVNAVAVLIIACPCAMGLATPVSIMVGTGRAAELGVLFRKGEAMQRLFEIDTIVLDKTGTLTKGKPELTDILTARGLDEADCLMLAASVEARSEHPLGEAVVRAAEARALTLLKAEGLEAVTGYGIAATVDGRRVEIGARRYMDKLGYGESADIATDERAETLDAAVDRLASEGKTTVFLAIDGKVAAVLAIADPLKADSVDAVEALKRLGLTVVMATGDNLKTANAIAGLAGIDTVAADLLPEGKVEAIKAMKARGRTVAFVGDGMNDAPALAAADTGIAIGTGTDVAIESADTVLSSGDLAGAVHAVEIGRAVMRNIRQNLFWAFGYNILLIPVAAGFLYPAYGVLLSPMIGAGAMGLSSVFVVTNALRLKRAGVSSIGGSTQEKSA
ncbi:heavy metal translocating P-type ATPase [Agrobacterium sp. ES01]|uniref:heavy metal translocating P-type ATPase n=1 Tax=Agrobacterium sp. ES01 TaxID=3420714 RepID=UPI003D1085FF